MAVFEDAPQRVAAVAGVPALLAEYGVPPERVLEGLPLRLSDLDSPENRLPYAQLANLLERCAQVTGCPHFGLRLGARFDHGCMGALGTLMSHAPTLEAALTDFVSLQVLASTRGAAAYLHKRDGHVILGYGAYDSRSVDRTQIYACVMAVGANFIGALTGGRTRAREVILSIRSPQDPRPYGSFFGAPVYFDQPESGLVLHPQDLAEQVVGADPAQYAALRKRAAAIRAPSDTPWSDEVRHLLRQALVFGEVGEATIAHRLSLHPKTLFRRLAQEGSSFRLLLAEIRYNVAKELLAITDLPIAEIASSLGYANQSAFTNAFRTWEGSTPSAWRAARA